MKRRCPNHWTKGTKKPFFIYLSSDNRSGSFCFYTQFKISFVIMLAISDVNSAGREGNEIIPASGDSAATAREAKYLIEDLFDEENIHKSAPVLLRNLIKYDDLCAKDYLMQQVEGLEKAVRQQAKLYTSRRLIKSVSKGADDVEDGFECENIESYQDGNQEKKEGMERARFEQFILKLAKALDGYKFYLPAYLDFRGRIYRTAVASCISTSAIYQEA
ncbi:hypothetical protein V6N11_080504 [Hibiscus sabdariffa]|uniref:Uncharacterized protein n=1 Tax=Hibiscus sabdariffa TaxID=183260 RepID=A0ABR2PRL4_9ROSI